MIQNVEQINFIPCANENKDIFMHKSLGFSARKLDTELIIFSKKECQFLFIQDHGEKLDDLGGVFDPDQTLSENLTSAIKAGIIARDARYGLLGLRLLDEKNHKEIFEISKMF